MVACACGGGGGGPGELKDKGEKFGSRKNEQGQQYNRICCCALLLNSDRFFMLLQVFWNFVALYFDTPLSSANFVVALALLVCSSASSPLDAIPTAFQCLTHSSSRPSSMKLD